MPIDFPNSPSTNQEYTYSDLTWKWNGSSWILLNTAANGGSGGGGISTGKAIAMAIVFS
jgi:hypothetical protein